MCALKTYFVPGICLFLSCGWHVHSAPPPAPPDLTQASEIDRKLTYNLGATGMRGWIYSKPASHFDGLQGRTTALSRQILVTHVGPGSPADGRVKVDDVLLGVNGKAFADDARKSLAMAIQVAEQEAQQGALRLLVWRKGKTAEVMLPLPVLGTYAWTAPYRCPKSKRIFEAACAVLEKETLSANWHGSISALALLSTGNPDYLPTVREFAHKMGPSTLDIQNKVNGSTWDLSYRNIFLCEYYLLTGDEAVLHAIREITLSLARGQSLYGTFGHGFAEPAPDGHRPGSIPPYGPVNQAGLPANIAILLGRKCGVQDPEVDAAIGRAIRFFGYYVDKGAIPYGEHEPWPYHENNGKCAMAAVLFSLEGHHPEATRFFAQMATAGYRNRESGHTGQGLSYLWGALGAHAGGPAMAAAFFKESSWHFDLVRRCDGSFTYDGGEQYGPGQTQDDTYFGKSGYHGLSPTATYVLTYALPLRKLLLTGRELERDEWLDKEAVDETLRAGRFDLDRKTMNVEQLLASFSSWSPIVRSWAAEELAARPEVSSLEARLLQMARSGDRHIQQGACETLGRMKSVAALPVLVDLLDHQDRWLRYRAASAFRQMGSIGAPVVPAVLDAVVQTEEPLQPIAWDDPVQLVHGQLAQALFTGPLTRTTQQAGPRLLHPAIRVISRNADGMARGRLGSYFEKQLSLEDVQALGPDLLAAIYTPSPADTMFSNEIRMGALKALCKYSFKEGVDAVVQLAKTQGGHGSEKRTSVLMNFLKPYGAAAQPAIPGLHEVIDQFNQQVKEKRYPGGKLNQQRIDAVTEAIQQIEASTDYPELRRLPEGRGGI